MEPKKPPKISSDCIGEIFFKEKSSIASRKRIVAKLDAINSNMILNVSKGYKSMVVRFEDDLDMLAFMVASGVVTMTILERKSTC